MTTNRERLAKMTDEELAKLLQETTSCERCSGLCRHNSYIACFRGFIKWLNQESEESYVNNKSY